MVEKVENPCIRAHKANRQKNTNRQENKPAMTQKHDIVLLETSTLVKSCLSANTFYAWKTTTLLSVKRKHVVRKHDVTYPARWGLDNSITTEKFEQAKMSSLIEFALHNSQRFITG